MKKYLKLARVHHWVKNLLIAFPVVFSGMLGDISKLCACLWGVAVFSLFSSAVYIFNDIKDAESDRNHPVKCRRPIASGEIKTGTAAAMAAGFFAAAAVCMAFSGLNGAGEIILPCIYILLNVLYSAGLKNKPLADIVILVSGFLIRVIYGGLIVNVEVSGWLYLTVMSAAFFFALGKRRNEIGVNDGTRDVLKFYSREFLDKNMYVFLALLNTFYALWCLDSVNKDRLIWTVPIVLIICMKYSMDIEGDSDGDPIEVLFHDKALLILCAFYAAVLLAIIY